MSVPSRPHRGLRRLSTVAIVHALALAVLGGLALALATCAAAHDAIIDAAPAEGAVLDAAPTQVVLTYSAEVLDLPAAIIVTDANGDVVVEGAPRVQGQSVVLDLPPSLANGTYEVLWSVVSSDGHRTEDTYDFTVAAGEEASDPQATPGEHASETPPTQAAAQLTTPPPAATLDATDASFLPSGWPIGLVLVPVAVLALALIAALVYRRRRGH